MKYVITGGAGNISKPLVLTLLAAGHDVTVIGRNPDNLAKELTNAGAKAAIGTLEDVAFLTKTFTGADAVYTMVPPTYNTEDWKGYIESIAKNYVAAIQAAGVRYVVNLSSVGAHEPDGCGPVSGLYRGEQAFKTLTDVHVKHLRPGFFYNNFLGNVPMVKQMNIIGGNYGNPDTKLVLVHVEDIAQAAAEELTALNFTGQSVRYIASDERSGSDVAKVLGGAIGKPNLPWVEFSDEQTLGGLKGAGLSDEIAKNYAEMGAAIRNGKFQQDYWNNHPELSKRKLEDFAPLFAQVYNAS